MVTTEKDAHTRPVQRHVFPLQTCPCTCACHPHTPSPHNNHTYPWHVPKHSMCTCKCVCACEYGPHYHTGNTVAQYMCCVCIHVQQMSARTAQGVEHATCKPLHDVLPIDAVGHERLRLHTPCACVCVTVCALVHRRRSLAPRSCTSCEVQAHCVRYPLLCMPKAATVTWVQEVTGCAAVHLVALPLRPFIQRTCLRVMDPTNRRGLIDDVVLQRVCVCVWGV